MEVFEVKEQELLLSTNKELLDIDFIHGYLETSYWSPGIPKERVIKAIENSLTFGLYLSKRPIGFCRIVTDFATFAYLADVFVTDEEKGKSFGKFMVENIRKHPELKGLRRWLLATKDAHLLYKKSGWKELKRPDYFMEIVQEDVYKK